MRRVRPTLRAFWLRSSLAAMLALGVHLAAVAQEPAEAEPGAESAASGTLVVEDEVRALVAPVALYPDPLLAVVLQASMFPVDVVQADRFIESHEEDQTLEPSPDWDPAVTALLGFPSLLGEMNEHLDWTQAMGDAVYDRLEDVQDAIQDLRQGAYAMGILASNEVQEVVVGEGIIEIRPASPDEIAIPQYDGFALLGSLEAVDGTPAAEAEPAEAAEAVPEAVEEAAPTETAETTEPAEASATAEPAGEAAYAETAEPAAPDAYAASYAVPGEPTYAQPPVYAEPPPPVAYAPETSSSGWGSTASFLGGAAVGGLLGYAIFDNDDDHDGGNNRRNDINIEDSTIVVGGSGDRVRLDQDTRDRVDSELRERRDRGQRTERRDRGQRTERRNRGRDVAALPGRGSVNRQQDRKRDVVLPQRDRDRPASVEQKERHASPALKAPKQKKAAVADIKRPSQAKKEAARGKRSRQGAAAKTQKPSRPQAAHRRSSGGKKSALAPRDGKSRAKANAQRGKKSRGGGRHGGKRGSKRGRG